MKIFLYLCSVNPKLGWFVYWMGGIGGHNIIGVYRRFVLMLWNLASFKIIFRLSNVRCPTGVLYQYSLRGAMYVLYLCLRYNNISAWASRCCSKIIGQCENLIAWNDNSRNPRFFVFNFGDSLQLYLYVFIKRLIIINLKY